MRRFTAILAVVVSVCGVTDRAASATISYTDESSFLAAAGTTKLESFEGLTPGVRAISFSLTDFTLSAPSVLPTAPPLEVYPMPYLGAYATDGVQWMAYDQKNPNEILRFDFSSPINSFGLNVTDWGDWTYLGNPSLIFSNNAGDNATVATPPLNDGNHIFFGIINADTSFTRVELLSQPSPVFYGVDEVYYGTGGVIPEPSTLTGLTGMAATALLAFARRRRTRRGGD